MEDTQTPPPTTLLPESPQPPVRNDTIPTKKNKRRMYVLIIIFVFLFLVSAISLATLIHKKGQDNTLLAPKTAPTSIPTPTTPLTKTLSDLRDLLTYEVPLGWSDSDSSPIILTSPEKAFNPISNSYSPEMTIYLTLLANTENRPFEERYQHAIDSSQQHDIKNQFQNITKTSVGGQEAFTYINAIEGYGKVYEIKANTNWIYISISSLSKNGFDKYSKEVYDFISSIEYRL